MNIKDEIRSKLIREDGKINSAILRRTKFKDSNLNKKILNLTLFLNENVTYSERIYCIMNDIKKIPTCLICNKPTKFGLQNKNGVGYKKYCSKKCLCSDHKWQDKTDYSNINNIKSDFIREFNSQSKIYDKHKTFNFIKNRINDTDSGKNHKFINSLHYKNNIKELYDILLLTMKMIPVSESNLRWSERFYIILNSETSIKCNKCGNVKKYKNFIQGYTCKTCNFKEGKYKKNRKEIINILKEKYNIINESLSLNDGKFTLECTSCHHIDDYWLKNGKWCNNILCKKCELNSISRSEVEIRKIISDNYNGEIIYNYRFKEHRYGGREIDIYIPKLNIGIEYNGLFWHSENNMKKQNYHINKTNFCNSKNIRLIHIFEDEWLHKKDIVISKLLHLLKQTKRKIYARKCKIDIIKTNDKKKFLNKNHLQGNDTSSINLCLKYDNEIVSVMTFCKSRFNKNYEWELSRYASKINTSIVGGANKIFNYFIKTYNPKTVITYADLRWSEGNMYYKMDFKLDHISKPNYWYIDKKLFKRISRLKYQKHKLENILENFNPYISEYENMLNNGFNRIWDCGNLVFIWSDKIF